MQPRPLRLPLGNLHHDQSLPSRPKRHLPHLEEHQLSVSQDAPETGTLMSCSTRTSPRSLSQSCPSGAADQPMPSSARPGCGEDFARCFSCEDLPGCEDCGECEGCEESGLETSESENLCNHGSECEAYSDCYDCSGILAAADASRAIDLLDHGKAWHASQDEYACPGCHWELFGDQVAEIYGAGASLPQLLMETSLSQDSAFHQRHEYAGTPAPTEHGMLESTYFSSGTLETSLLPTSPSAQAKLLEAARPSAIASIMPMLLPSSLNHGGNESRRIEEIGHTAGGASSSTPCSPGSTTNRLVTSCSSSATSASITAGSTSRCTVDSTPAGECSVRDSRTDLDDPAVSLSGPTLVQCQWVDWDGFYCGKIFALGSDMHNHLRNSHRVRGDVYCRWFSCRVSVFHTNPHKFSNDVERHTWGHSGYRPYRCPTCSEGFAAAKVRDEHFASVHLKTKLFGCDACTHECSSLSNLRRHKKEKHAAERFQCEFCASNGKISVFSRGPNLARHFRQCKYVLAIFPEARCIITGKVRSNWFPSGYRGGPHGLDKGKIKPSRALPIAEGERLKVLVEEQDS